MNTAPRFSHGVMTITLDGQDVDLAANVHAARTICRLYGGLTEAYNKVNAFDFDAVVNVINAATRRVGKAGEETAEAVFSDGILTVAALVILYLNFLSEGGKGPKTEAAPAAGEAVPAGE